MHLLRQHDPAARRIGFLTEFLIRGTGGKAKSAMNTLADRISHVRPEWTQRFDGNVVLH
jgi:hypothetical protein